MKTTTTKYGCPHCLAPRRHWRRVIQAGWRKCNKCKKVFNMKDCKPLGSA